MPRTGKPRLRYSRKMAVAALLLATSLVTAQTSSDRFSLYLDQGSLRAEQRSAFEQRVLSNLRAKASQPQELKNLRGDIVARAACPVGYVSDARYRFSTSAILVVATARVDCDSVTQCRAWEIEASPADAQASFDLTIQLQCSADDTVTRRNRAELGTSTGLPSSAARK